MGEGVERKNEIGQSERQLIPGRRPRNALLNGETAHVQMDGEQNTKVAKRAVFKEKFRSRLSFSERREFRWWFWRKKGGIVRKREYVDERWPKGRYETHYILPGWKKPLRSWKKCVEFMGSDPDPSTTSWASKRGDETGLAPIEVIPGRACPTKRMRGQLTSPIVITTAGSPTSLSATNPKVDNCANVDPPGPVYCLESQNAGHPNILLLDQESEDSSNEERPSLQLEGRLGAPNGFGYRNPRSKKCITVKSPIGNEDLQPRNESAEGEEEKLQDMEIAKMQSLSPPNQNKFNKTIIPSVQNEPMDDISETTGSLSRTLIINSSTEETTASEAKASTKVDVGKDEAHSTERPLVMQHMSVKELMAPPPAGTIKLAGTNDVSKENRNHTSEETDHNKRQMNHSPENVVISYEESNYGPREQAEGSILSVDDETLQKNLINLLYADHIKQPSKQAYSDVIGKLYAEFIERSFAQNRSCSNSQLKLLAPATTSGKREEHEVPRLTQPRQSNQEHGTLKKLEFKRGDKTIQTLAEMKR